MNHAVKTRLLLVRHGQSVANAEHRIQGQLDTPLSAIGVAQCLLLAERFGRERVDALYSSPLMRARATAEAIGAALHLSIEEMSDLRERDACGKWPASLAPQPAGVLPA